MALGRDLAHRAAALRPVGALAFLLPVLVSCAGLPAYHPDPVSVSSRLTVIDNFSTEAIDPEAVDALLIEVADILDVQLDPAVTPPRIVVTEPGRIAQLYDGTAARFPGDLRAMSLYYPGRALIRIPRFDRILLGHELAHYLTDFYLGVPRAKWEGIAQKVEWKLLLTTPRARPSAAATLGHALP
jgi:hypothetical protein